MKRTREWVGGAALLLAATILFTLSNQDSAVSAQRPNTKPKAAVVGDLYKTNCARCHGADGRGDTPLGQQYEAPDFTDPDWWRQHTNSTRRGKMRSLVASGKGEMPAFDKKLTRSQIGLLVDYVRRFRKPN
jgi:mono/diheme cytochrome c family protein